MKRFKKILSIMLTLAMVFTMTSSVFAATGTGKADKGTITITNPQEGKTYNVYRILDLESYNTESRAYSYKVSEKWKNFFVASSEEGKKTGFDFVTISKDGYVTWKADANAEEFAKLAIEYAKNNLIEADATPQKAESSVASSLKFTDLTLGYYLVDSNLGTLCSLGTTSGNVDIREKNVDPTIEKEVSVSSASIGQTINYDISINATDGAVGYVVKDIMSKGLTYNSDSLQVTLLKKDAQDETTLTNTTDKTYYTTSNEEGYTFVLTFDNDFLSTLETGDTLFVKYTATVNADAITTDTLTNKAELKYGDNSEFTLSSNGDTPTTTEVYSISLNKVNEEGNTIQGAKFKLYDSEKNGKEIAVVKVEGEENLYRVASEKETGVEIEAGNVLIKGLGAGTYWLEETKAPEGYNILEGRQKAEIVKPDNHVLSVSITNKTGSLLPSTGGIGTTIFYIVGAILVVGAAVLLVTKKRMSKEV